MGGFLLFLLVLGGCSNADDVNQLVSKYDSQIENQNKEIIELKEENEQLKTDLAYYERQLADYRSDLQRGDRNSRAVMRLISEGKFEELKKDFNAEFEVKDGKIDFGKPEGNFPFRVDLAGNFMTISYTHKHPNGDTDVTYYIYDYEIDGSHLITVNFDKDWGLKFIFVGDR